MGGWGGVNVNEGLCSSGEATSPKPAPIKGEGFCRRAEPLMGGAKRIRRGANP
jgi:hypothetical protein